MLSQAGKSVGQLAVIADKKFEMMDDNEDEEEKHKLSELAMKAQEGLIRNEVESLLTLLTDLYLGQLLISRASQSTHELRLRKYERWIRQLSSLLRAFDSDAEKSKNTSSRIRTLAKQQSASTADYTISRHGNILQHLLSRCR